MPAKHRGRTVRALEWSNFFLADVQAGVGPFVAAYLAASGWTADRVGMMLTLGGIVTVALETPAGAMIDGAGRKRAILFGGVAAVAGGALLLAARATISEIVCAEVLIGAAGARADDRGNYHGCGRPARIRLSIWQESKLQFIWERRVRALVCGDWLHDRESGDLCRVGRAGVAGDCGDHDDQSQGD
jgi:MFS family permease